MNVHFLGIGGSGASSAFALARSAGITVSGCDKEPFNEFTRNFNQDLLYKDHSPDHLNGIDILAVSPAVNPRNEELKEAKKQGIKVMTWQQFMGEVLQKDKFVIGVCGTHGKSTTTAMIGLMLEDAELDPTVQLGAIVPRWRANYRIGKSRYFVTESDEFNDNFLSTTPDIAVVTTIEMDHPEYFKDFDSYKESYRKFLRKTKLKIVANMADPNVAETLKGVTKSKADFSQSPLKFPLQIPGKFNAVNAAAVYQVGILLNIPPYVIEKSLLGFSGIGRRFEKVGEVKGATVYSDFAHHPAEIEKTMQAARETYPENKIYLVYQPHMFTRTHALFDDFVKVFQNLEIDQTYILDIYASREADTGLVSSKQVVEKIDKRNVVFIDNNIELLKMLKTIIRPGDVLFFVGAGDIDGLARKFVYENDTI